MVFREIRRVLAPGGLALIAFHVGQEAVHVDDLFGAPVDLDFRFHSPCNRESRFRRACSWAPTNCSLERETG
jgi:hypothetical protein